MKEPVFASAVVYVRNEERTAADFIRRLDYFLANHFEAYELILVNDHSTDGTLAALQKAAREAAGSVTIINLARRHGVELGILAGLDRSVGDFVFELESTVEDMPLTLLLELYKTAAQGYDIVSASPARTSLRSRLFYQMVNRVSYLDLNLATETVRLVSRRALNAMLNLREKVRYRKALYAFTGYPRSKIVYEAKEPRRRGLTRETITLGLDIIVSFTDWGLRVAHTLSMLFFVFSLLMVGYVLYNYTFRNVVEGWTTIMTMLCTGFSGVFFILGLMGEYIARILTEVQNRPLYSVRSSETYGAYHPAALAAAAAESAAAREREAEA